MSETRFENSNNPIRRLPIYFLFGTSTNLTEDMVNALEVGLRMFIDQLKDDPMVWSIPSLLLV
jgi:uncharacterized protein YegL